MSGICEACDDALGALWRKIDDPSFKLRKVRHNSRAVSVVVDTLQEKRMRPYEIDIVYSYSFGNQQYVVVGRSISLQGGDGFFQRQERSLTGKESRLQLLAYNLRSVCDTMQRNRIGAVNIHTCSEHLAKIRFRGSDISTVLNCTYGIFVRHSIFWLTIFIILNRVDCCEDRKGRRELY